MIHKLFLILFALLIFNASQSQSLRKGPYLILTGTNTEMEILWQLDTTAQCTLKWGINSLNQTNSTITTEIGDSTDEHQHIYVISSLTPNQKYFYTLYTPNDTISSSFFAAQDNSSTETILLAYGDTRSYPDKNDSVCFSILYEINLEPSSQTLLLHAGDFNSDDTELSWDNQYFNRNYDNLIELQSKLPIIACRGNHEGTAEQYHKYWPYNYNYAGDYYSFDYGLAHISVVDLYADFSTGADQLNWLQNDLATSDKIWKLVLIHEPAYTDTTAHLDNINVQNYIVPVCKQNGVKVILAGHNHYYAHCLVDSIHHLTLGGGGAPLYAVNHTGVGLVLSESSLHYAKIKLTNTSATFDIVRPDNSIIETFVIDTSLNVNEIVKPSNIDINVIDNEIIINQENNKKINVTLYNDLGQIIDTKVFYEKQNMINVFNIKKGVYILSVKAENINYSKKIILGK
jgi:predicted phosphodiesterase